MDSVRCSSWVSTIPAGRGGSEPPGRPQAKPAFPWGWQLRRNCWPTSTFLALLPEYFTSSDADLLLSWMHLTSLAGALKCDCLTATASCPSGLGWGGWERDKKRSFMWSKLWQSNKVFKVTYIYIVLHNLQNPRELLFILQDPAEMLPLFHCQLS